MSESNTILTNNLLGELERVCAPYQSEAIYILVDENTKNCCLERLQKLDKLKMSHVITIPAGDEHKNLENLNKIWKYLTENGATRKSLMINLGGGMLTDIGGFAASTFKRGIKYVNISTTLLGAVDAATGGKTGINFLGFKNEIGTFAPAEAVLLDVSFFKTLDNKNIRSGYAEMVKHALIYSKEDWEITRGFDLDSLDFDELSTLLKRNVEIKEDIVEQDPKEIGIRKALNFGHTIGHAIETLSYRMGTPMLHGYAVAYGMLCEAYLSHMKRGFPKEQFLEMKNYIFENYGRFDCACDDVDELIQLMKHDKKNEGKGINFTLLDEIGVVVIDQIASEDEIREALEALHF